MKTLICLAFAIIFTTGIIAQNERFVITHPDFGKDFKKVKGGEYAANAGSAEVDRFASSFNHGVAVVQKGNAYALIDAKGQFVIPFGAYRLLLDQSSRVFANTLVKSGIFTFSRSNGVTGLVNYEGKVIGDDASHKISIDGAIVEYTLRPPYKYILPSGKTYTSNTLIQRTTETIGYNGSKNTYIFTRIDGKKIFEGELDYAGSFVDGMCLVGKKDQYNVLRYGFINSDGAMAVPFQFSVKPTDYSGGYAKIKPANDAALAYGFIDKKGNIVSKQSVAEKNKYGEFSDFVNGLSFSTSRYVMDTTFQPITQREFLDKLGLPQTAQLFDLKRSFLQVDGGAILWYTDDTKSVVFNRPLIGFINFKDKVIVMPSFSIEMPEPHAMQFDPVAGLMPAKIMIGRNETTRNAEYVEGMINRRGEFVMVLGKKAVW